MRESEGGEVEGRVREVRWRGRVREVRWRGGRGEGE